MRKIIFLIPVVLLFISSCSKKSDPTVQDKKDTVRTTQQNNQQQPVKDTTGVKNDSVKITELKWEFEETGRGQYDEPNTNIHIIVNGSKKRIAKTYFSFSEIGKSEYNTFGIPKNALIACRGWWAGAGEDYWVIRKGDELDVMMREIGESVTEDGEPTDYTGKPKKIKTIKPGKP